MAYKHLIEFAARGGILGGTFMVTNYIGVWGRSEESHDLLQRVKTKAVETYQLARMKPLPVLEYMKTHIGRDKLLQKYNNGIIKTVELLILTPDLLAKMMKVNYVIPLMSELLHSSKIRASDFVSFIHELKFPEEHDIEEGDGQIHQLKITEDLSRDVHKAFEHEEGGPMKGIIAGVDDEKDGKDDKENMGPILDALPCTGEIIKVKSSSSDN